MSGRPEFKAWIDEFPDPGWKLMPLTHVTSAVPARDIIREETIGLAECKVFNQPLAYFFYGRPAYRLPDEGTVKLEAACPFCFILKPDLIKSAKSIYAFDTGAFQRRMYKHVLVEEMNVEDFSLEGDVHRPNKMIAKVFSTRSAYFDGDIESALKPEEGAEPWDFLAKSYLELITSRGRNEPDDRICSIEVIADEPISLAGNLLAVIVPHTIWDKKRAPWLEKLSANNVEIRPYTFIPGRHPEYYHALLEIAVREFFQDTEFL